MLKIFLVILIIAFVVLLSFANKQNKKSSTKNMDIINRIKNRERYEK